MNEKLTDSKKQVLLMTDAANPQALKAVTGMDKTAIPVQSTLTRQTCRFSGH